MSVNFTSPLAGEVDAMPCIAAGEGAPAAPSSRIPLSRRAWRVDLPRKGGGRI